MNIRGFLFLIFSILHVFNSIAQITGLSNLPLPGLKVDNWQIEQGLPVNSIITITQTSDGWLYFGTEEGLVKFDGNSFFLMNNTNIPGLSVNFISTLLGGRDTSLWIGTEGDGLIRYKNNEYIKYNKSNGLSDNRIFSLFEDPNGGLWVGTSGSGLNYLKEGKISRFDTANGLASNYIRAITTDSGGRIWVGTQKGLSVIDSGKIKNYFAKDGLSDDFIEALVFDKDNHLWIGTKSGGLNLFSQDKFSVYTTKDGLTDNSVTSLCLDRNGMLWIGANGGGITRMMNGKFYPFTTRDGLSGDLIVTLFEDRQGNIWAGSSGSGIDRIKKKLIQTIGSREGLPGEVILPVFEDHEGALWFGIAGKGLCRFWNGQVKTYTHKDGLPNHLILTICEDFNHTLWIGTAGGGLTNLKNGKFTTYTIAKGLSNNVVIAVYCDRSGTLWAGTTGGGINFFKNGSFTAITTKDGLSHDNITCVLEDRLGNLWVGTNNGLNKIRDQRIDVLDRKNGLSDDYILSLYEDKNGNLWIGTASNGFNLLRDGKITQFTTTDGLINEVVLKILEDQFGYFWISCNKGIYKIKKQDLLDFADLKIKSLKPVSYGKTDGMETIECNGGISPAGIKTRDGKLLLPTMKGVAVIDPGLMKTVASGFSPVFIEEFLVDGQGVKIKESLSIPSYSKRLEFRYAALNYTNPEKIRYRCMLVGFDKDWIENDTRRIAYYTNIPGGDYIFKVMASNESGQWDEQSVTEFKFRLTPPFYRSFLFYLIIVIFVLLLLFFITYYFMGRFQRNRLKLLVEKRTNELHQKMMAQQLLNAELVIAKEQAESGDRLKTAFMNNISHEIRTPLNGIIGFSQLMADPGLTEDERAHYNSIVKSSSSRLINTVTDYMDISLIASGNQAVHKKVFAPGDLMDSIYTRFSHPCQTKGLTLTLQTPQPAKTVHIHSDYEMLSKVLSHLVDNAVKFTRQGTVSFGYSVRENEFEFYVKDTGSGISREVQPTIFDPFIQENVSDTRGHEGSGLGLSIAKGFVELLGGRIWLESEKARGSSFFFTILRDFTAHETSDNMGPVLDRKSKPLILIAEDEESGSILLEKILLREGIESLVVTDGLQAVSACRQNPMISLVLMDLKMPVMNGFEATKEIKSFRPNLPVIAVTAFARSGDEKRAREAGCNDYIAKPFERAELLDKIKNMGSQPKRK